MKFVVFWDFFGVVNTGEPVVAEVLGQVVAAGGVNVLVSYSSIQEIDEHLDEYSIGDKFDAVFDMEQVIEHGDTKAGVMQVYLSECETEVPKVVIGDSLTDVQSAKEIGADSWLFDPHMSFRDRTGGAEAVVHQLDELPSLMRGFIAAMSEADGGGYTLH